MSGAAYEATGTLTDDESFGFSIAIKDATGTALPLAGYAFEYELNGCGTTLRLSDGAGITADIPSGLVVVDPGADYRLCAGKYRHGFRLTHVSTGVTTQLFDGSVTVTEGNFQ